MRSTSSTTKGACASRTRRRSRSSGTTRRPSWSIDRATRRSTTSIHDGTPYPEHECPLLRPRATGEVVRVDEDWFVRRDGTHGAVAYSSAPVETSDGGRGAVVVFRDISDRLATQRLEQLTAARDRGGRRRAAPDRPRPPRRRSAAARAGGPGDADGARQARGRRLARRASCSTRRCSRRAARSTTCASIAAGLHPAILTNRGLPAAVESLIARAQLRGGRRR